MRNNSSSISKKRVSFRKKQEHSQLPTSVSKTPTQISSYEQDAKSQFTRKKMFNVQECKFLSLKNINIQGSTEPSSTFDPGSRLKQKITKMEDLLVKVQRSYLRKIKNLGKKYNKQCEKEIRLAQEVMELKNELKKNKRMIEQLKILVGKQNLRSKDRRQHKSSSCRRRFRPFNSPSSKPRLMLNQMSQHRNIYYA